MRGGKRQENTHEKRGGSFGEPVGEGDYNNSLYATHSDFLGGSQGHIGLGARADLRSCSEWYKKCIRDYIRMYIRKNIGSYTAEKEKTTNKLR